MKSEVNVILNDIVEVSNRLSDSTLKRTIEIARSSLANAEKLRLTIVGQHFSELPEILSDLVEKPQLFNRIPRNLLRSYVIKLSYNEADQYKILTEDGGLSVTKDIFHNNIIKKSEPEDIFNGEIGINSEILKVMDITVVCSANSFEEYSWTELLCQSDYIVLVLKADALLSISEKRFAEEIIKKHCAVKRFAFVLNNFERIQEGEQEEVINYINHYIASLDYSVPIYTSSTSLNINSKTDEGIKEFSKFTTLVREDLPRRVVELHENTYRQIGEFCIAELMEAISLYRENLKIGTEKIEKTIDLLNRREENMAISIQGIKRKIQLFINGSVKIDFLSKVNDFNRALLKDLEMNILDSDNLKENKKNISSYLEYVWGEFFSNQEVWLKNQVFSEMAQIIKIIETDIEDYVTGIDEELGKIIANYLGGQYNFKTLIVNRREKDAMSSITKYMNLGSIALIFINLPWAAAAFGTSQLLRLVFKESIKQGEKEAVIEAVNSGCDKLMTQIVKQVDIQFNEMIEGIKVQVEDTYNDILSNIKNALSKQKEQIENSQHLLKYMEDIEQTKVPEMRSLLIV